MGKRLALFLDGTWNVVSDNTNVWRLRSLFARLGSDGREQRAYYSTGLGTKFGEKFRAEFRPRHRHRDHQRLRVAG